MRVALYARVSTEDQHFRQQLERLRKYAQAQGWEVAREITDEESGRLPLMERKKFRLLLNMIEEGARAPPLFDAVVVFNIDRLTRNWEDQAKLERAFSGSCTLLSMSDAVDLSNAAGRLMFRMKMAVACYMPEDMLEKQRVGIERAKAEGKYKGGRGRPWLKD